MSKATNSRITFLQRGAVAIEFAIIVPALLLFVLGIMDTGRLLWTYTTVYRASEAAARCFAILAPTCTTAVAAQSYAVTQAWGLPIAPAAFAVTSQACGARVIATYGFQFVIPWLSNSITLTATACYPI